MFNIQLSMAGEFDLLFGSSLTFNPSISVPDPRPFEDHVDVSAIIDTPSIDWWVAMATGSSTTVGGGGVEDAVEVKCGDDL